MYIRIISKILLIIILVCLQIGLVSALPGFLNQFNLIIITLVFILAFVEAKDILFWSLGFAVIFELYSFLPPGVYLLAIVSTAFFIKILMTNFFTDRSLYSFLAITFFSIIYYDFFMVIIVYLSHIIFGKLFIYVINKEFWFSKLYLMIFELISVIIIFNFINFVSKKLRPVFLFKKR